MSEQSKPVVSYIEPSAIKNPNREPPNVLAERIESSDDRAIEKSTSRSSRQVGKQQKE
jgi:hypothetical protein